MTTYHLQTLGRLALRADGPGGDVEVHSSKGLAVLAYLSTTPDHSARRDFLASILWPDSERPRALQALRQALYYVGRNTKDEFTRSTNGRLALYEEWLDVDVWRFDDALEAAKYEAAIRLYGGPFLAGFGVDRTPELEHWIAAQQDRVRTGLEGAYDWLVAERLEKGDVDAAVGWARRWASVEPVSTDALARLVQALTAAGDDRGAFRAYERYSALAGHPDAAGGVPDRGNGKVEELRRLVYGDVPGPGGSARRRAWVHGP